MKNNKILLGYIFAILATVIWSGNFIIARGLSDNISPISLAFYRWLVAVLILLPFAIKQTILHFKIIKENIIYLIITSFLGVTIFNTLIYFAGRTTTAMNLSLISITFPIFVIIFSRIFLKEPVYKTQIIGILLVIFGIILLITKGKITILLNLSFAMGDLWMLIAAIIFAIYSILLKYKPKQLTTITFQFSTFAIGLFLLLPFFILGYTNNENIMNTTTIGAIIYIGLFASLIAYILWGKAISLIGTSSASMVYYTLPIFNGILGYLLLNENLIMIHLYSISLILVGILIVNYKMYNKTQEEEQV